MIVDNWRPIFIVYFILLATFLVSALYLRHYFPFTCMVLKHLFKRRSKVNTQQQPRQFIRNGSISDRLEK
jgi:hypothetical protein